MDKIVSFLVIFKEVARLVGKWVEVHNGFVSAAATVVIAAFTVTLWLTNRKLWKASQAQSMAMEQSINEAARSANAMQRVARSLETSTNAAVENVAIFKDARERQLRAYIAVGLLAVINQDNSTNYHFEVREWLANTGPTPAQDVSYKAHADILPFPLPDDFPFPLPDATVNSAGTVYWQQKFTMSAFLERMLSDEEIAEIKGAVTRRLYVYGTVNYRDAFGNNRYTNFCHSIVWLKDGTPMGHNTKYHNDAN